MFELVAGCQKENGPKLVPTPFVMTNAMLKKSIRNHNSLWVEHLSPLQEPSLRLFCFPYAGGTAHVFRTWQRQFPPEIDLCLVHLPGRGKRSGEQPFTNLKALVEAIAEAVFQDSQDPCAFYGHSMGALISFELARLLRRRHLIGPRRLFLSGRRGPTVPSREQPTFNLPNHEFIAKLKDLNGTPPELLDDRDMRNMFVPLLRADFEIVDTYEYWTEEPLDCPITVYGGAQDPFVTSEDLHEWQKQTLATFQQRVCAGDHFFIHSCSNDFMDLFRRDVLAGAYEAENCL
jgi:medium-chain acyl-[acyl-carrier-protein] hydrolase